MATALLALDIDGTLVDETDRLSPAVRDAVRRVAREQHVVIATGRSVTGADSVIGRLGLDDCYAVCSNGAVVVRFDPDQPRGWRLISQVTFDPAPALLALRRHLPDAGYAVEDLGFGFRVCGAFPDGDLTGPMRRVSFEDLLASPASRVVVRKLNGTPDELLETVHRIGLHDVSFAVGTTAWLDLGPLGVSKASGLELVCKLLDVPAERVVAVGDGMNDLEMFAFAGRAVAMGNAREHVRAAADEVTGTVEDDGLLPVLDGLA